MLLMKGFRGEGSNVLLMLNSLHEVILWLHFSQTTLKRFLHDIYRLASSNLHLYRNILKQATHPWQSLCGRRLLQLLCYSSSCIVTSPHCAVIAKGVILRDPKSVYLTYFKMCKLIGFLVHTFKKLSIDFPMDTISLLKSGDTLLNI